VSHILSYYSVDTRRASRHEAIMLIYYTHYG